MGTSPVGLILGPCLRPGRPALSRNVLCCDRPHAYSTMQRRARLAAHAHAHAHMYAPTVVHHGCRWPARPCGSPTAPRPSQFSGRAPTAADGSLPRGCLRRRRPQPTARPSSGRPARRQWRHLSTWPPSGRRPPPARGGERGGGGQPRGDTGDTCTESSTALSRPRGPLLTASGMLIVPNAVGTDPDGANNNE